MTWGLTGVCRPALRKVLAENNPFLAIFRQFLDNPPMFMKNLQKNGPLFREFFPKNPPIWAAHTRTLNMLCTPPPPRGLVIHGSKEGLAVFLNLILFHHQTVCFGTIDCSGEISIFQALSKALSDVYVPALDAQKDWGEMSKSPQGIAEKDDFLKFVDGFVSYLDCESLKNCFLCLHVYIAE